MKSKTLLALCFAITLIGLPKLFSEPNRYKGEGLMNVVYISTPQELSKIEEVNFMITTAPDDNGDFLFTVSLEPGVFATGKKPNLGIPPIFTAVAGDIKVCELAIAFQLVDNEKITDNPYCHLSFSLNKEFIEDSYIQIQLYPNTDSVASIIIKTTATLVYGTPGDDDMQGIPILEYISKFLD